MQQQPQEHVARNPGKRTKSRERLGDGAVPRARGNGSQVAAAVLDDERLERRGGPASVAEDDGRGVRCTVGFFGLGGGVLGEIGDPNDEDDDADSIGEPPQAIAWKADVSQKPNLGAQMRKIPQAAQASPVAIPPRIEAATPPLEEPPEPSVSRRYTPPQRSQSQPPPLRPVAAVQRDWVPKVDDGQEFNYGRTSPGGSVQSDPSLAQRGGARPAPWKQKPIQLNSANHYLDLLKQARSGPAPARGRDGADAEAWAAPPPDGSGYAREMRQRASAVEALQKKERGMREERGYAVLQRVQQRALQAAPRSASCDV